jgi:hypothetical protein
MIPIFIIPVVAALAGVGLILRKRHRDKAKKKPENQWLKDRFGKERKK